MTTPESSNVKPSRSLFLSPYNSNNHRLSTQLEQSEPASPVRPLSGASGRSSTPTPSDKRASDHAAGTRARAPSRSSMSQVSFAHSDYMEKETGVRTLPPWVMSPHDEHEDPNSGLPLSPTPLQSAKQAQHIFMPTPKGTVAGRHFDHAREQNCVTISNPISEHASRWLEFTRASRYKHGLADDQSEYVSPQWLQDNLPDLEKPWRPAELEDIGDNTPGFWLFSPAKRKAKMKDVQRILMKNPVIPLLVRLTVLIFSIQALGLAGSIFHRTGQNGCDRGSSTWLAIIIDVVAIVYTMYITYDEYTSRPLGLRSARSKMRLIFLDLVFIVFDSANLSLAFDALTDERWACRGGDQGDSSTCAQNTDICVRQKALAATLLVALVAWIVTFAISTFRIVERVAGR